MCAPVAIGVLTAASGAMSAIGQHQAQQAAVNRQNQIQQQQYQNQLRITEERDRAKKDKHAADLQAHASAQTDLLKQQQFNQMEARVFAGTADDRIFERHPAFCLQKPFCF